MPPAGNSEFRQLQRVTKSLMNGFAAPAACGQKYSNRPKGSLRTFSTYIFSTAALGYLVSPLQNGHESTSGNAYTMLFQASIQATRETMMGCPEMPPRRPTGLPLGCLYRFIRSHRLLLKVVASFMGHTVRVGGHLLLTRTQEGNLVQDPHTRSGRPLPPWVLTHSHLMPVGGLGDERRPGSRRSSQGGRANFCGSAAYRGWVGGRTTTLVEARRPGPKSKLLQLAGLQCMG